MQFFQIDKDSVIGGYVATGSTNYDFALNNLYPLIGRLDIQRDTLKTKFYTRLEEDIVKGCVMPPITIALVCPSDKKLTDKEIKTFIQSNMQDAFILDGIQRLNTLNRASSRDGFDASRTLHFNFIIANSRDKLLYRMITLNNGQKAMSARHQIEIIADAFYKFSDMPIKLVSEKGKGRVRAPETFKKADFVKGYVAYLSKSVNIDNQKIIEEKMDELIASRIIDSDIPNKRNEFSDVVDFINKIGESSYLMNWIRVQNNFIGFCVGAADSLPKINEIEIPQIEESIKNFEAAFDSVNVSKVNIGKIRREIVSEYIKNFSELHKLDEYDLLDQFSRWV